MELITVDDILEYLEKAAEEKLPLSPSQWVDASLRLQSLLGNEMDHFYGLESKLAVMKVEFLQNGMKVNQATAHVQADPLWLESKKLKGKIERVTEIIRLAKLRARMADQEYKT